MSSVDNRIVNMQFNSKQFTQGASQSQAALDKLEQGVGKAGRSKGLTDLGNSVGGLKEKFSIMQVAGVTAVATIANKAVNAGLQVAKSLTIDPIMQGFQEYQTNLNSIQTVMANTGKDVDTVNGYMEKLNHFSDQTIYNFSEMARNIGTFTAAGVNLETATASIKGISTLAALSGSNSTQASTAMYQLSQAISAGKVGLQDWNSVVNAGMGGKVFQTALAQTGVAMKSVSADAVELGEKVKIGGESFRQSISAAGGGESWLTGDVLTKTLENLDGRLSRYKMRIEGLSKAQIENRIETQKAKLIQEGYDEAMVNGMIKTANQAYKSATVIKTFPQLLQVAQETVGSMFSNSFSIILGDFEESKKLWTTVGKSIVGPEGFLTKISNSYINMLKSWKKQGGRDQVIEGLGRIFQNLGKIVGAVSSAFQDAFPPTLDDTLVKMSFAFNEMTKGFVVGEKTVDNLKSVFGGLFSAIHIVMTLAHPLLGLFVGLFNGLTKGSGKSTGGILELLATVGDAISKFDEMITKGGKINNFFQEIGEVAGVVFKPLLTAIEQVGQAFGILAAGGGADAFKAKMDDAKQSVLDFISNVLDIASTLTAPFGDVSAEIDKVKAKIDSIRESFDGLDEAVTKPLGSASKAIGDFAKASGGAGASGLSSGFDKAKTSATGLKNSVSGLWSGFNGADKAKQQTDLVAASVDGTGASVAGMADEAGGAVSGLSAVFDKVAGAVGWLSDAFKTLFGGYDAVDWASTFNAVFTGVVLLNLSKFLKTMNQGVGMFMSFGNAIKQPFLGLADGLRSLGAARETEAKAELIRSLAISIGILTVSMIALSFVDPKKIGKAMGALAGMMGLLVGTFFALSKMSASFDLVTISASMVFMSTALLQLSAAILLLGTQDMTTLAKGLGAVALGIGIMVGGMLMLDKMKNQIAGGALALIAIATAINMLIPPVTILGLLPYEVLMKGFGSIAIGIGLLAGGMLILDKMGKQIGGAAAALIAVAIAINILVSAVLAFGNMDPETLKQGFTAVAIGLALMSGAILLISNAAPGALGAAAAMVLLATSLAIIVPVILALGAAPWEVVARGIGFMAAALAVLLIAAAAAMVVAPGLYALGITIGLLGAAIALAGVGMLAFGVGFALFAAAGVAGVAVLIVAFQAFMALLPTLATQIGAAFVAFLEVLAKLAPRIREALRVLLSEMLGVIEDSAGEFGSMFSTLISEGIKVLRRAIPEFIELGFTIIDEFLKSADAHIPSITKSVASLIRGFLDSLNAELPGIIESGTNLIISFIQGIGEAAGRIALAGLQTILKFINAMEAAVRTYGPQITNAGISLADALIDATVGQIASRMANALQSAIGGAMSKARGYVTGDSRGGGGGKAKPSGSTAGAGGESFTVLRGVAASQSVQAAVSSNTRNVIAATLQLVNAVMSENTPSVSVAAGSLRTARGVTAAEEYNADYAQKRADAAQKSYDDLSERFPNAKRGSKVAKRLKSRKNAANSADRVAQDAANRYEAAQRAQDARDAELARAIALRDADTGGKADIYSDQAQEQADAASEALARADAQFLEASRLKGKAADKMLAQAQASAAEAANLANAARTSAEQARALYAQEVNERAQDLESRMRAADDARAADAAYKAADDNGKIKIMEQRLAEQQAKAASERALAVNLIAQAKAIASTDAAQSMRLLDQAETASDNAEAAADAAQSAQETIEQLRSQNTESSASSGGGTIISPSKTALEDAAKSMDRYTEAKARATEQAGNTQTTNQYIQNNYSPTQLSTADLYRQGSNLLRAREDQLV